MRNSTYQIAYLASNLAERRSIVNALAAVNAPKADRKLLDRFTIWKIAKLSDRLTSQRAQTSSVHNQTGSPVSAANNKQEVQSVLTNFELYALNFDHLDDSTQLEFLKPHSAWINTYRRALETMELPRERYVDASWHEPSVYYGAFGKACEPFLRLLHNELQAICGSTPPGIEIAPRVIADIERHLLGRFDLPMAWALEADINVYCAEHSIDKLEADSCAYKNFVDHTFRDRQSHHQFYCRFPVLGRWLARLTGFVSTFARELIGRLVEDREEVAERMWQGRQLRKVTSVAAGKSDFHAGGKSVVFVELELDDQRRATVVYKPRCIRSEAAMQELLRELNSHGNVTFGTYNVICRDGYGYAEFLPSDRTVVKDEAEAERFYHQLGGYLAIFYILGGGDLHFQNIHVVNGNAFICDCETVLSVKLTDTDLQLESIGDSVFQVGMLEWPRHESKAKSSFSGYSGGESYEIPFLIPQVVERSRLSLGLHVENKAGLVVETTASNRITFEGRVVEPQRYQESILEGFNNVYEWFHRQPDVSSSCVRELFGRTSVRFLNLGTQAYVHALRAARHPKCLSHPVEADLAFQVLQRHRRPWDDQGKIVDCELKALWDSEVPVFTTTAQDRKLRYAYEEVLPNALARTAIENSDRRIRKLSSENRERQNEYIRASLSVDEIRSPYFVKAAVDYAKSVGRYLIEKFDPLTNHAPWQTHELTSPGVRSVDVGVDLYHGAAGICFFLAYLDSISPDPQIRQMADRALSYAVDNYVGKNIGVFTGDAGLIYLLTHLSALRNDSSLLDQACELARQIAPLIEQDERYDILNGVAGVIPVMLGLAEATDGEGLGMAVRCGDHLLEHAVSNEDALSWCTVDPKAASENLSGFSHGTAGIGWALISLGQRTNRPDFVAAGRKAFAYELRHYDEAEQDWFDLRTSVARSDSTQRHFTNAWCNGAAGIGLARISSWALLGGNDQRMLRESQIAVNATVRNFRKLGNNTLCHGRSGNSELFLRYALLRADPSFQVEANVHAQAQLRSSNEAGSWTSDNGHKALFPGLMIGLAGLGLHFLRLAHPERVPSPLLLDAPSPTLPPPTA